MNKELIKTIMWVFVSIGSLIGGVVAVQAYTDGKYVSKSEQQQFRKNAKQAQQQFQAVQKVIHTKQYNSNMIRVHETNLKLSELEISYLESQDELSKGDVKKLKFLEETADYHRVELRDARIRQGNPVILDVVEEDFEDDLEELFEEFSEDEN